MEDAGERLGAPPRPLTGARPGELRRLTKAGVASRDGVPSLHIREDAAVGRRVKNKGSVRRVPLHRQFLADGFPPWATGQPGDALFGLARPAASKRLNRRMRAAGLGG